MPKLFDSQLEKTYLRDKQLLEQTKLPIVSVSATYQEDLKGFHGLAETDATTDVVLSRAHYSMALAAAVQAWGEKIDPKKAWLVDPTNYVQKSDWKSVKITEFIGKILARTPLLKKLKDLVDKFGRQKLPILDSITPPLLYLTQNVNKPILSFHIAAGNILAGQGKQIYQMITDPHVRSDYLAQAHLPNITYLVFDQKTKTEFLEKAATSGKPIPKNQIDNKVIVTGPPIDPRIIKSKQNKKPWRSGPIKLCLSTGGLGTNKDEMRQILTQLLPELRKRPNPYQLLVYAGTHHDIYQLVKKLAAKERVAVNEISLTDPAQFKPGGKLNSQAGSSKMISKNRLSLIYHPQIIDANELLIRYGFPWADGFISKPSGDMAYDAAASGSFLLTLQEWGEWEHNIRQIFEEKQIARPAQTDKIVPQLEALKSAQGKSQSWVEKAMHQAQQLEAVFLQGVEKINQTVLNR
ncbi:MAG: hypothetical protein GF381_02235 [Candidatus Pacebacteria bacterium]|nr:hypothetical protein [Candidatus Paceibacterota bacterium]